MKNSLVGDKNTILVLLKYATYEGTDVTPLINICALVVINLQPIQICPYEVECFDWPEWLMYHRIFPADCVMVALKNLNKSWLKSMCVMKGN